MFLEYLDFLSPTITLFHYGRKSHSSKLGGILTIIGCLLCLAYIINVLVGLVLRTGLSLYYYKKFEWEVGKFFFDNNGIYHFIQFYSLGDGSGSFSKYDKKYVRIFTSGIVESYASNPGLLNISDHWVYDLCEKGIDDKGLDSSLFDKIDNYTNSACIKYYFSAKEGKYYNKSDKEFIYPSIEHGNSRRDNTLLGTIIERCRNNSITGAILGECGGNDGIEKYLKENLAIYFQYIDHQVDPTNTRQPIQPFMNSISGRLSEVTYPVHNINFSPLLVKTDKGFIRENFVEDKSFIFDMNRKDGKSNSKDAEAIISAQISYWIQNNFIIYERTYKKILDIIPTIGGIAEVIYYILFVVNILHNKYILLLNTKSLFVKIQSGREINLDEEFKNEQEKFVENYKDMEINGTFDSKKRRFTDFKGSNIQFNLDNLSSKQFGLDSQSIKKSDKNMSIGQSPKVNNFINHEKSLFNKQAKNEPNISFGEKSMEEEKKNKRQIWCTVVCCNDSKKEEASSIHILGENKNEIIMNNKNKNKNEIGNIENNSIQLIDDFSSIQINDTRYHAFKEELKYYMNENKKKVKNTSKKMIFMEQNFSFFDYFLTLFSNKKNKQNGVYILNHFRKKLLSEEHFYRSHLNLYLLEKYFDMEQEKADILELFKNL